MDRKKILIADDEGFVLDILAKKFRENNYEVITVMRGKDAIEKSKSERPDLVLLDIAIPDIDGYTVAAALKKDKSLKNTPIIFLTGKELEHSGIERRVGQLGVYSYIVKPTAFADILQEVKKLLG